MAHRRISPNHVVARSLAASIALTWFAPLQAAWEFVPQVGLLVEGNSNPRLQVANEDDASRAILDVRATLSNYGERGNIFIEPRVRSSAYADEDDDDLDNDDVFVRSYGQYAWTSVTAGYYSSFERRSIQSSEFVSSVPEDPDLPLPPDVGTGELFFINQDQDTIWFAPFVEYDLSPRSALRFEYQSIDVSYTGPQLPDRGDFREKRFYTGLVRHVDSRTDVSARAFVSHFEGDVNQNETETAGVEGRFTRPMSEVWSFSFGAGVQRSDFRFIEFPRRLIDNATSNVVADIEFRQRSDLRTLDLRFAREIYPTGSGFLSEVDQVSVFVDQDFTPKLSGRFGFRYDDIGTIEAVETRDDRDYARIDVEFRWQMSQRISLLAGYQFTAQDFPEQPLPEATANAFYFGVNYRGLSRTQQ
jgi:hypothetical protein